MNVEVSFAQESELKPKITVFGVGGAGGNAVNNMLLSELEGVEFWVTNTDAQALSGSLAPNKIQLGVNCTKGLGAGSHPEVGKEAAEESADDIKSALEGCNMLFITAGMGGGTGTGAAPVIASVAREMDILVVAVVTKPFHFEGARRMKIAELGLEELESNVDTLIIIPNQNLFRIANEKTTFMDAFKMADNVLHSGVRGVTDLINMPGIINLDFADIYSVMRHMGKAMMGTGEAEGENRAVKAAELAISNPLLDHSSMKGARAVLINITGGIDMTLFEVDEAANRVREEVDPAATVIFGSAFNNDLAGKIRVSVVATGIDGEVSAYTGIPMEGVQSEMKSTVQEEHAMQHQSVEKSGSSDDSYQQSGPLDADVGNYKSIEERLASSFIPNKPATVSHTEYPDHFASDAAQKNTKEASQHTKEQVEDDKGKAVKDDILNIPAFFRRKKRF